MKFQIDKNYQNCLTTQFLQATIATANRDSILQPENPLCVQFKIGFYETSKVVKYGGCPKIKQCYGTCARVRD